MRGNCILGACMLYDRTVRDDISAFESVIRNPDRLNRTKKRQPT